MSKLMPYIKTGVTILVILGVYKLLIQPLTAEGKPLAALSRFLPVV
jgi:hypothetical protein